MMTLDKIAHALVGAVIYLLFDGVSPLIAAVLVVVAGVGKEIADKFRHGQIDHADALATVVGGAAAFVASMIIGFVN